MECQDIPNYYFRSYKVCQVLTNIQNYNFILNSHADALAIFFEKLTTEVLNQPNSFATLNLNHLGLFLKFLAKNDHITFQAYCLIYNLPFNLIKYLHNPHINDIMVAIFSPLSGVICENSEETLMRYSNYCRFSGLFADLGEHMFLDRPIDSKKMKTEYRPMFIGDISKVVASGITGAALEIRDIPEEEMYIIAEEKKKLKTDIDLLLKHFNDIVKKKPAFFKMKTAVENLMSGKSLSYDIAKSRNIDILEKLKNSKDVVIMVDYDKIKDVVLFEGKHPKSSTHLGMSTAKPINLVEGTYSPRKTEKSPNKPRGIGDTEESKPKSLDGNILT